jgi:hypothetical protein
MLSWLLEGCRTNGQRETKRLSSQGEAGVSMSVLHVKPISTETKSKQTTSYPLYQSQDGTLLIDLSKGSTVTQADTKFSAKNTTKKKQRGKIVSEGKTIKKSRVEAVIRNLENDEFREEMTAALAKALKTNGAIAEQYVSLFTQLDENNLLDLVTKSATIRKDVRKRVLEGINKSLEKYNG